MTARREPGTFWLIDGHRYYIDPARRYLDVDQGRFPFTSLDDRPGTQLHLSPVDEAAVRAAVEAEWFNGNIAEDCRDRLLAALVGLADQEDQADVEHQRIGGGWRCSCGTPLADTRQSTWQAHLDAARRAS